jgi:hypothetical protein
MCNSISFCLFLNSICLFIPIFICLYIKVPTKCIGAILGVGGSNIKSMQETTGASIRISNGSKEHRLIYIFGSRWSVQQAQMMCLQIIYRVHERTTNNGGSSNK